jgi:hypothetical protein
MMSYWPRDLFASTKTTMTLTCEKKVRRTSSSSITMVIHQISMTLSGFHFIARTSRQKLLNATAMRDYKSTFVQRHTLRKIR